MSTPAPRAPSERGLAQVGPRHRDAAQQPEQHHEDPDVHDQDDEEADERQHDPTRPRCPEDDPSQSRTCAVAVLAAADRTADTSIATPSRASTPRSRSRRSTAFAREQRAAEHRPDPLAQRAQPAQAGEHQHDERDHAR